MKNLDKEVAELKSLYTSIDRTVKTHAEKFLIITPVVKQAAHRNVVIWLSAIITILNLIILILHECKQ